MHGYDGWHMGGMWVWWILILVAMAGMAWFAVTLSRRGGYGPDESPELALKRRLARGEMDREQYDRILSDLRK